MSISQKSLVVSVLALSLASSQLNAMEGSRPDAAPTMPAIEPLSLPQTYHGLSEQFTLAAETNRIPMELVQHVMQFYYHSDPIAFVQKLKGNEIEALFNRLEQESVFKMALRFGYAKKFGANIPGDELDVVDFVQNYKMYGVNDIKRFSTDLFKQPYLEHVLPLLESLIEQPVTALNLSNNQLTALPESIGNLVNLKELWLYNNQLTEVPESIDRLVSLEKLSLSINQLTALPKSIGNLENLKELYLYKNKLTELPESIGKLENLEVLWLYNNQLTGMPKIRKLANLKTLWLNDNQLNDDTKDWLRQQFDHLGNKLILD